MKSEEEIRAEFRVLGKMETHTQLGVGLVGAWQALNWVIGDATEAKAPSELLKKETA